MKHVSHWWIHPFHGWARTGRNIGSAVCKFAACGAVIAKGFEGGANLLAAERGEMVYAFFPTERPLQRGDQLAGQTKR